MIWHCHLQRQWQYIAVFVVVAKHFSRDQSEQESPPKSSCMMAFDMNLSWESRPSDLHSSISSMSELSEVGEELPTKRAYAFHDRRLLSTVLKQSDDKFRQYFRMERSTFGELLKLVQAHLPDGNSSNGKSLLTEERLLAFLMFIASNELLWTAEVSGDH